MSPPPSTIRRLLVVIAFAVAAMATIGPALLNGFPLVYNDTGTYLHGAFSLEVAPDRPIFYSLFIAALQPHWFWGLWPVVIVQALLTTFVLAALLVHFRGPLAGPGVIGLAAALTPLTALPWFASQIMPDIFAPLLVLSLYLLAAGGETLSDRTRAGLAAVAMLAMAVHFSHMLIGIALLLAILAARLLRGTRLSLGWPAATVVAAVIVATAANYVLTKQVFIARSGPIFLMARLVQDGVVTRLLQDVCPSPDYTLCAFRDSLPRTVEGFLWDDRRALERMGGWTDAGIAEAERMIGETLVRYPWMHIATAAKSFGRQLIDFRTGEGLSPNFGPPFGYLEMYMPDWLPAYRDSLQQTGRLDFRTLNLIHVPAGAVGQVFLILALIFARSAAGPLLSQLLGFVAAGLLTNAFVCAVLSVPNDRYQSRMVWLAVLTVALAMIARPGRRAAGTA